jgi:hypothetical protein
MRKELSESIKMSLIQILNQNIRLDEAVKSQEKDEDEDTEIGTPYNGLIKRPGIDTPGTGTNTPGTGMPSGIPEREDKTPSNNKTLDWDDVLMGKQSKMFDMDPKNALGLALGGKAIGLAGRFGGQSIANLFGGGKKGMSKLGGGLGDILTKITSDIETLSGGPGLQAQIGDIARAQVANRWQGAGYTPPDGWFKPIVPKTGVEPIEPEIEQDRAGKLRQARKERLADIKLANAEKQYGLPPLT